MHGAICNTDWLMSIPQFCKIVRLKILCIKAASAEQVAVSSHKVKLKSQLKVRNGKQHSHHLAERNEIKGWLKHTQHFFIILFNAVTSSMQKFRKGTMYRWTSSREGAIPLTNISCWSSDESNGSESLRR